MSIYIKQTSLMRATLNHVTKAKKMSKVLCFPEAIPKEKSTISSCKSFKLMLGNGYIKHVSPGVFNLMPLAVRSLEKLCGLIDIIMERTNGQKVLFPTLIQDTMLKTSCRWNNNENLFKLKDRHSFNYCLGATHEEVAASLMSKFNVSYKSLPLLLYQISNKFRDEMNPKLGLLRGREFLMKDMYTFDSSKESSQSTYEAVCDAYLQLFGLLGIDPIKVKGSGGDIGGESSHEFHFPSEIGEDEIFYCPKCNVGINGELQDGKEITCQTCSLPLQKCNAIEVGHAFLLGTLYSSPFQAKFDSSEHLLEDLQMGCYGLGVTRILAASVEYLSDSNNIRWPLLIAPYHVSVIPPKKGSREESVLPFAESLADSLSKVNESNVLIDERTHLTIGKRVQEASAIGVPFAVVVGKPALEDVPKLEVIDIYKDETFFLTHKETLSFFRNKFLFSHSL